MPKDLVDRIKATEQQFRVLFDNPKDRVWVLDVHTMKFIYVSDTPQDFHGRTSDETMTIPLYQQVSPEFMKFAMAQLEIEVHRFRAGEHGTVRLEAEVVAKDGSIVKTYLDMRLFEDEGNLKVIGITRDPSHMTKSDEKGPELEQQLHEVLAQRDRLRWEVKILQGLLPICSNCKKIRDEDGNWIGLEEYVQAHSEADFTHTICPPCRDELYPGL